MKASVAKALTEDTRPTQGRDPGSGAERGFVYKLFLQASMNTSMK